ncbi:HARBI1 [Mytilus coruscus]|uniref:HARBI1 n=1 Tax=Mytilus coruscus TaxID=42192 RepID=A0A6J8A3F1_MYTCO|nr:HARBI1 [Mytilus coruscus]
MAALDLALFHVPVQRKERTFRSKEELTLDYTDTELRARYRFGREGILFLSNLVRDKLTRQTNRNLALSVEQQIMVTLRFLASGSFLQVIGDTLGLDKSTVSRVVCAHMERNGNWENGILLGDSGYPCRSFLMTPFLNPNEQHHRRYNRCHAVTRSVIERTFGRWKRRFHILHSENRMDPKKVTKIVMVCGILHNICIQLNEPDVAAEELVNEDVENGNNYNGQQDGRGIREHIAETYFNRH